MKPTMLCAATGELIEMRPEGFQRPNYASILLRLVLVINLVVTALARFDHLPLSRLRSASRLGIAAAILISSPTVLIPASVLGLAVLGRHYMAQSRRCPARPASRVIRRAPRAGQWHNRCSRSVTPDSQNDLAGKQSALHKAMRIGGSLKRKCLVDRGQHMTQSQQWQDV